jgi:hypothetical protein
MCEKGKVRVVRRERGKRLPPNAMAVDRSTKYGNPFKIGPDGDRDEVITKHREWLNGAGPDVVEKWDRRVVLERLAALRGQDLACYCAPEPCHADYLLELANAERPDVGVLPDELFEPDGLFGKRGIERFAAEGVFSTYARGDAVAVIVADPTIITRGRGAVEQAIKRAARSSGIMMTRFAVPGGKAFITGEMRPDNMIWSGERETYHTHSQLKPAERRKHVARSKITGEDVCDGTTPAEYDKFAERYPFAAETQDADGIYRNRDGLALGADHFGEDTKRQHIRVPIAKYTFGSNPEEEVVDPGTPHRHEDYLDRYEGDFAERLIDAHERYLHGKTTREFVTAEPGDEVHDLVIETTTDREDIPLDKLHDHKIRQDIAGEGLAKRLSIHPLSRGRLMSGDFDRIVAVSEGCLKEAAAVSHGEVTLSWPSITLRHEGETEMVTRRYLAGRRVYVVCDSDWSRPHDDAVLARTLISRDAFRWDGADAYAVAPPTPVHREPEGLWEIRCADPTHDKHGLDDHYGPCTGDEGTFENMVVIDRETPKGLAEWIAAGRDSMGRKRKATGLERYVPLMNWIALHAGADGTVKLSLRTVAACVQREMDFPTFGAAYSFVKNALDTAKDDDGEYKGYLVRSREAGGAGTLEVREALGERVSHHYRKGYSEWTGEFRVVEPLQAETILRRVRDLEAENPPRRPGRVSNFADLDPVVWAE